MKINKKSLAGWILGTIVVVAVLFSIKYPYASLIAAAAVFIAEFIESNKNLKLSIQKTLYIGGLLFLVVDSSYSDNRIDGKFWTQIDGNKIYLNSETNAYTVSSGFSKFYGKTLSIDNSEYKIGEDFTQFHDVGDVEIAVPIKNSIMEDYLVKIDNKILKTTLWAPDSLFNDEFKESVTMVSTLNGEAKFYIHEETEEMFIRLNEGFVFIVGAKTMKVDYNKEDYFSFRASKYNNKYVEYNVADEIQFVNTFEVTNNPNGVTRVSFYDELKSGEKISSLIEIIYDDYAYVARLNDFKPDKITSVA